MYRDKDPQEDTRTFDKQSIVITEGLYLLSAAGDSDEACSAVCSAGYIADQWREISENILDLSIYLDVPIHVAADRVIKRHVSTGICNDTVTATERWNSNDALNAVTVSKCKCRADVVLTGVMYHE